MSLLDFIRDQLRPAELREPGRESSFVQRANRWACKNARLDHVGAAWAYALFELSVLVSFVGAAIPGAPDIFKLVTGLYLWLGLATLIWWVIGKLLGR